MIREVISNRYKYDFGTFWQGQAIRETGFLVTGLAYRIQCITMYSSGHSLSAGRNQAGRQRAGSKASQVRLQRLANGYRVKGVHYRDLPGKKNRGSSSILADKPEALAAITSRHWHNLIRWLLADHTKTREEVFSMISPGLGSSPIPINQSVR